MAWLSDQEPIHCDWCKHPIVDDEPVAEIIDSTVFDFCSMVCYDYFVSFRNKQIEILNEATAKGI